MCERSTTCAKTDGLQVRCYGEHVGGIHWELGQQIENMMVTYWELKGNQGKLENILFYIPPPPNLKMQGTFGVCSGLPVGCMKFLLPKEFITIFRPTFTPHKSNFFSVEFDWPMSKSWNPEASQKFEDSMDRWSASPFRPLTYVRRGGLWAKHMGLKQGAIGNTHGEHIGNLLEQRKKDKNLFAPPPQPDQTQKKKK